MGNYNILIFGSENVSVTKLKVTIVLSSAHKSAQIIVLTKDNNGTFHVWSKLGHNLYWETLICNWPTTFLTLAEQRITNCKPLFFHP